VAAESYDDIKNDFEELRDFFKNDLCILIQSPTGGNYAATLVATTACEVLGPLRFENNGGCEFFRKYLLPESESWQAVAPSLYNALRNGLAHSYATKTILNVNGTNVELGVSWSEKPHLQFDQKDSVLYINVRELAQGVNDALAAYENELKVEPQLRVLFARNRKKKMSINVQTSTEREAWKSLLSSGVIVT
jgi:hypothetical protein